MLKRFTISKLGTMMCGFQVFQNAVEIILPHILFIFGQEMITYDTRLNLFRYRFRNDLDARNGVVYHESPGLQNRKREYSGKTSSIF